MTRWIGIMLLILLVLPHQMLAQEMGDAQVAICLRDLDTPPEADLAYIVKGINATIMNRLAQFPGVVVYAGKSAPGEYFKEPEKSLTADKVQLLQIRRETGFDGLIFGRLEKKEDGLLITLHLVDFSSGRIYFTGELQGRFGSSLLSQMEEKITRYADALIRYYSSVLAVTSEPAGAEVWVDNEKAGMTPIDKLDVKDGKTQIQVKMRGYVPFETQIELQAGQKALVNAHLDKIQKNFLTATSQPSEAEIYLNGRLVGVTPANDLSIEQPNFTVKFTKKGFAPCSQTISLRPGEQAHVHAELYDLLVDHLRNKKSPWEFDSHNFSYLQTLEIQDLDDIEIDHFTAGNLRYYAKFGRFSSGFGIGWSTLEASQHFDTFLDVGEGYEPFTIDILKGTAFSQYNILEKITWLELYLGANAGFSLATSAQPHAPADLSEQQKVNPLVGGEIGANFYLGKFLKLSAMAGGYYAGKVKYAQKEAPYWGEAKYREKTLKLHPFYVGLSLTISLWPALM